MSDWKCTLSNLFRGWGAKRATEKVPIFFFLKIWNLNDFLNQESKIHDANVDNIDDDNDHDDDNDDDHDSD